MQRAPTLLLLLALPLLGSCSLFGSMFGEAKVEAPPPPDETYLGGNAGSEFDIGKDQESLLEKLHQLQSAVHRKDEEIAELRSEKLKKEQEARNLDHQLATAKNQGNSSKAQVEALTATLEDLRTQILILQIQNAKAEQSLVERKLSALRQQAELQNAKAQNSYGESGTGQ